MLLLLLLLCAYARTYCTYQELLAKTKEENIAGWTELDIHGKRTKMYTQMKEEVEAGSMLPSIALSSLFEKRL